MTPRARLGLDLACDAFRRDDLETALKRFIDAVEQAPDWPARLNIDPVVELMMTAFRRWLALHPALIELPVMAPCVDALVTQGRINEFVFYETAEERTATTDPRVRRMYRAAEPDPSPVEIERLGVIDDPVSAAVAAQYEENPYPRWIADRLPPSGRRQLAEVFERHGVAPPGEQARVLIAGCGTGRQAAQAAATFGPAAAITATDLSRASLAYAARQARALGIDNVRFVQSDILGLAALGQQFDVVACTGVLHHMADPIAGWRVLADLVAPEGAMLIGLYSARARAPLQLFLRRYPPDPNLPIGDRIRDFRRRILIAHAHEWKTGGIGTHDFFSMSGCRDLFFPAHEAPASIGEIARDLDALDLSFMEFVLPARIEGDHPSPRDLEAWGPFEERHPATFLEMYQFWCRKRRAA